MNKTNDNIRPWVRTVLILPAFILVVGLFQMIGDLVLGLNPLSFPFRKTAVEETISALFTLLGTFVVVGIFRHNIDKENFRSLGFYLKGFGNEIITGLALGTAIMTTGFATLIFFNGIQWTGTNMEANNILLCACLFVLVAFAEELLLRGYVLNNLMKSMNRLKALLVSSVMFSLGHIFNNNFSWIGFWNLILAGILLGLPYIYTKSLWLPIALHFSWNFFQGTIFGFNVSGHLTYSLITQSRTADTIWNGGKFGFEGSAFSLVFQIIAIGGLWWYYSRRSEQYQLASVPVTDQPSLLRIGQKTGNR